MVRRDGSGSASWLNAVGMVPCGREPPRFARLRDFLGDIRVSSELLHGGLTGCGKKSAGSRPNDASAAKAAFISRLCVRPEGRTLQKDEFFRSLLTHII
jgi:hypothetical protein